jgi:hypothetical protein
VISVEFINGQVGISFTERIQTTYQQLSQKIRKKIARANELAEAIGKVADDSEVAERK